MNIYPLLIVGLIIVLLGISGFVLSLLFVRSSKDLAYVRTGYGGEKIIFNSGSFVLPFLHKTLPVSLNSKHIQVSQLNANSIITKDRLRADITVEFYLKVDPSESAILIAAQSLGRRTLDPVELNAFLSGQLISFVRQSAVSFTLDELQTQQQEFIAKIFGFSEEHLLKVGMVLETVSVIYVEQSDKSFFDPNNIFDTKGLTKLTKTAESEKELRNDMEQNARIKIKQKQMEADKIIQELEKENINNKGIADREKIALETANQIEKSKAKAQEEYEKEQARILMEQKVKLAEQTKEVTLADNEKDKVKLYVEASIAKAEMIKAEENILTARELAKADRMNKIDMIQLKGEVERETLSIKEKALAEKYAAQVRSEAHNIEAKGRAEAMKLITEGKKSLAEADKELIPLRYSIHSEGLKSLIEIIDQSLGGDPSTEIRSSILESLLKVSINVDNFSDEHYSAEGSPNGEVNSGGTDSNPDINRQSENEFYKLGKQAATKSLNLQSILKDAHQSGLMDAVSSVNKIDTHLDN